MSLKFHESPLTRGAVCETIPCRLSILGVLYCRKLQLKTVNSAAKLIVCGDLSALVR